MRYLAIFLLFFSANLFAQDNKSFPGPDFASCSGGASVLECFDASFEPYCTTALNNCLSSGVGNTGMTILSTSPFTFGGITVNRVVYQCSSQCTCPNGLELRAGYCECPAGKIKYQTSYGTMCGPAFCPEGQVINIASSGVTCVSDTSAGPPEDCPADSMVYDPVSGILVCPGSGDSSSSASSNNCVVPGDYDGDCVPDDSSSAASSGAAPSSASGSSSGNDGGGDSGSGSSSGSGSGGDGDSGSGPGTGGGSGGGSGPGTGTGTNPGGSSAGSNTSSGSGSSWTPNSGYGNWIPVSEGSNCPNKYQDANGQWWCAGSTGGAGSSSGAGQCDPTSKDYLSCISQQQTPSSGGSGSSACTTDSPNYAECSGKVADSEGQLQQLGDKFSEDIDTQKDDYEQALDDDLDAFTRDGVSFKNEPSILKSALISFLPVSTPCNPPPLQILGRTYQMECDHFNTFKQAFGWFLAVLTVWNIWQMAIRPVDR